MDNSNCGSSTPEGYQGNCELGIVSPGPVDTDMQKAYRANAAQVGKPVTMAAITPADSARGLVNYIEGLGADKAGRFWSAYTGQEVPW